MHVALVQELDLERVQPTSRDCGHPTSQGEGGEGARLPFLNPVSPIDPIRLNAANAQHKSKGPWHGQHVRSEWPLGGEKVPSQA